jgi:ubiquinol-cytochrome c reductase cytochrome b subunit
MFASILALLVLPFSDLSKLRGIQFRPISKIIFFSFVAIVLMLMQLGGKHVEDPFIELGQVATILYFGFFLVLVPAASSLENSLADLVLETKTTRT